MSNKQKISILKGFQKAPTKGKLRCEYFDVFGKKMAYRTTKTENSEVTLSMVEKVFHSIDVKKLPYRANVGALIFKGDKYLLVQRTNWPDNFWKLPQGGIDEKENKETALMRELSEELGTDTFKIIKKFPFTHKYDWDKESRDLANFHWRGQKQTFFLVEFTGEKIKLNKEELKNHCWVTKEELLKKVDIDHPLFKGYKKLMEKLLL